MNNRDVAVSYIQGLMERHGVTLHDLQDGKTGKTGKKTVFQKIFSYIGGTFIFAGLGVFISMFWNDLGTAGQIAVTLGAGLILFIMGVIASRDKGFEFIADPLFIISTILQPAGILVWLNHISTESDPARALFIVCLFMLLQQVPVLISTRRPVLAVTSMIFYGGLMVSIFDILDLIGPYEECFGLVLGISYLLIGAHISKRYERSFDFAFSLGGLLVIFSVWDILADKTYEFLFMGIAALLVYFSTLLGSRGLLIIGTFSLLGYIGKFSYDYFEKSLGWPVFLVFMGICLIGIGRLALKLDRTYIKG